MIAASGLRITVGERVLLDDLAFTFSTGEFVAVLGPNGVGKSTLLRTLAGIRHAAAGSVCLNGAGVDRMPAPERARSIALVAGDDLFVESLTVRDVASMGRYAHHSWWQWNAQPADDAAISAALAAVGASDLAERAFETLSSGERQRVWIAMALAQEAPVLLLDEPTSHLDVRVAHEILALLREQSRQGKTVVSVLHDVNEAAQFADRVLLLGCGGMLAFDTPAAVFTSDAPRRAYGIAMETVRAASGHLRIFPAYEE